MSFRINTNTSGNFANVYAKMNQQKINKALEQLATGLRINRAGDDSAGMAIANQLRSQGEGLAQANKNAADAVGLVKIADGAMNEYQKILVKVRDKALQAASDTQSVTGRAALNADVTALLQQAQDISQNTEYNGIKLLDGTFTGKKFQVGSAVGQTMTMSVANTDLTSQGLTATNINLNSQLGANTAITNLDLAIKSIDTIRAGIGSTQNALESRIRVNDNTRVNVQAAESQIRDADYSQVQKDLNKFNIIQQANTYSLKQSFQTQQQVLGLLR